MGGRRDFANPFEQMKFLNDEGIPFLVTVGTIEGDEYGGRTVLDWDGEWVLISGLTHDGGQLDNIHLRRDMIYYVVIHENGPVSET